MCAPGAAATLSCSAQPAPLACPFAALQSNRTMHLGPRHPTFRHCTGARQSVVSLGAVVSDFDGEEGWRGRVASDG